MTVQTRTTIELGDITALEYECSSCHAKSIRRLDAAHQVPLVCGNCNYTWLRKGSSEYADLVEMINTLQSFRASSVLQHVGIRLEVTGVDTEADSSQV